MIWLRITNDTEYRAWNQRINGVRRVARGTQAGYYGVVNLLAPRSRHQRSKLWSEQFTMVQLNYTFMTEVVQHSSYVANRTGVYGLEPLSLQKVFISFWDFDSGTPRFDKSYYQREALQVGPQADFVWTSKTTTSGVNTEVKKYENWSSATQDDEVPYGRPGSSNCGSVGRTHCPFKPDWVDDYENNRARSGDGLRGLRRWELDEDQRHTCSGQEKNTSKIYRSSTYGVGDDNPADPSGQITDAVQRSRTMLIYFERCAASDTPSITCKCTHHTGAPLQSLWYWCRSLI